jgi:hypothetical protein
LNWCEWAALVKSISAISGIMVFAEGPAVPHGLPLSEEALEFLTKARQFNFQRGPLLDLISRVEEARGRLKKMCDMAGAIAPFCADILDGILPDILADSKLRTHMLTEFRSVCSVLVHPGASSTTSLVADFREHGTKSLMGLACSIVEARKGYQTLKLDVFNLFAKDEVSELGLLASWELESLLAVMTAGLPIGTLILDQYLKKTFRGVQAAWVDVARPSFRLLESAETRQPSLPDPSSKSVFVTLLGLDMFEAIAKEFGARAQSSQSCTTAWKNLPVAGLALTFNSMLTALGEIGGEVPIDWLEQLPSMHHDCMKDKALSAQIWADVLTKVTSVLSFAAHLTMKQEEEKALATVVEEKDGVSHYTCDPALGGAIDLLQKMFAEVLDDIASIGEKAFPFKSKLEAFWKAWSAQFFGFLSTTISKILRSVSQTTHSMSPNWKYFITDEKYNTTLAKKHLLTDSAKTTLGLQANAHFAFAKSISEAFSKWGVAAPSENQEMAKDFKHSGEVLQFAQETVVVMAAATVLEETPRAKQAPAAAALLQHECANKLPQSLKKLLQALKAKSLP